MRVVCKPSKLQESEMTISPYRNKENKDAYVKGMLGAKPVAGEDQVRIRWGSGEYVTYEVCKRNDKMWNLKNKE